MKPHLKVLVASGSRHSIPPVKNSPGVPRIIYKLTEKDTEGFHFLVLSKYDKALEELSYNPKKYIHPKPNLITKVFEKLLNRTPYRLRKKKYGMSQPDRIVYYTSLVQKAKKINPDIVVTFMHIELFKMLKKALPNAKHVFFYRSTDLKGRIGKKNIKYLLNKSAGFLANTSAPLKELKAISENISFPMATIYNSVPKNLLTINEQKNIGLVFRRKFGIESDSFVLGYAGRFSEEKSLKEILETIKELKDQGVIVHLIIAGDITNEKTPDSEYYYQLIKYKNEHLISQVHLAGWITNTELYHFYCSINLGILLSKYREGNSMFLIEALSYGIPVIATAVGGNKEIVTTGYNGVLINRENIKDNLKENIVEIIKNVDAYRVMSENALEYINQNHSEDIMKPKFNSFIERIINNNK